jgi:hypothetical protein
MATSGKHHEGASSQHNYKAQLSYLCDPFEQCHIAFDAIRRLPDYKLRVPAKPHGRLLNARRIPNRIHDCNGARTMNAAQ